MTSQTARRPTEQVSLRTLALIAALGILLRVIIAYVALPPDAGFAADLNAFRSWASELGTRGPWGFYARGMFVDYLPGYMWVLWALGSVGALFTGSTDPGALVKLPAILADGLLVLATARLAADHENARAKRHRLAETCAALKDWRFDSDRSFFARREVEQICTASASRKLRID